MYALSLRKITDSATRYAIHSGIRSLEKKSVIREKIWLLHINRKEESGYGQRIGAANL